MQSASGPGEPLDPMWRRFRERHPDITLVLLPDIPPSEDGEALSGIESARSELAAVERLAHDASGALGITGSVTSQWKPSGRGMRPESAIQGEELSKKADPVSVLIAASWEANQRQGRDIFWVDGNRDGRSLRLTVINGTTRLAVTGRLIELTKDQRQEIIGGDHE